MFSHLLLFVVMLLVAKRLVEVVSIVVQRLGRQTSTDSVTMAKAVACPKPASQTLLDSDSVVVQ